MIPSLSEPSWTSVSDRIIPSDSTPRSFALPRRVPSGSTAPGSATITAWPAATFGAPHTIVRSSDAAEAHGAHAQPVGVGVRRDVQHVADAEEAAVAVDARDADARDALDLGAAQRQRARELVRVLPRIAVLLQP